MAKSSSPRVERIRAKVDSLGFAGAELKLIQAFGEVLNAALPPERAPAKAAEPPKGFHGGELHQYLLDQGCSDHIALGTYTTTSFIVLNNRLREISGLTKDDMYNLATWINSGGLSDWPVKPTWEHLVKHIVSWITKSRECSATKQLKSVSSNFR